MDLICIKPAAIDFLLFALKQQCFVEFLIYVKTSDF